MAITLNHPVLVNITDTNAEVVKSYVYQENVGYWFTDHPSNRSSKCRIVHTDKSFVLWSGAAYDAIGNYTQEDVDSVISGLITPDPAAFLSSLFTGNASGINIVSSTS